MNYDAIVIGFGQGASTLVSKLTAKDWKVALIEKDKNNYGGSCINIGCIPTKILEYDSTRGKDYGESLERRNAVVEKNRTAEKESMEENEKVDLYTGSGSFIDDHTVKVETAEKDYELKADYIIIDTGSEPVIPPIEGLEETDNIYTSTTLQLREALPEKLGIVGAGNIGLEYASIYANFGSEVTLIDPGEKILEDEEPEVAEEVRKVLKDKGIAFHGGAHVEKVESSEEGLNATTDDGETYYFDALLVATGRKPHISSLNLENTGIELTENDGIQTNNHLETAVKGVYAVGDVRGEEQYTYVTVKDAGIVYNDIFEDSEKFLHDRKNIPSVIFMNPSFAKVGLTEKEAIEKDYRVTTNTAEVAKTTRSDVIDDKRGLYKAVVNDKTNEILGVTMFGDQAHELVNFVKLAMNHDLPYTVFKNQTMTHPVMSEILNELFTF